MVMYYTQVAMVTRDLTSQKADKKLQLANNKVQEVCPCIYLGIFPIVYFVPPSSYLKSKRLK